MPPRPISASIASPGSSGHPPSPSAVEAAAEGSTIAASSGSVSGIASSGWTWTVRVVSPARIASPSLRSTASTLLPLTNVPLVLAMSTRRHLGGFISIRKCTLDSAPSTIGSVTPADPDLPTTNVSCPLSSNSLPRFGPLVALRRIFMPPSLTDAAPSSLSPLPNLEIAGIRAPKTTFERALAGWGGASL